MHTTTKPHWFVIASAFAFIAPSARAEMITPDSIPNPPASVGSANLSPIYSFTNFVSTQYKGLGLNFSSGVYPLGTAITHLNGVDVWAPAAYAAHPGLGKVGGPPLVFPVAMIDYNGPWPGASLVMPGTLKPTTASSVTLEILGRGIGVSFFNSQGGLLGTAAAGGTGLHGGRLYTFTSLGISSFTVFAPVMDPYAGDPYPGPAWGVASVSFTLPEGESPEPSSLVLAGLGALVLAARCGRRRSRVEIA
jgi:hypothetical protein